jgi:N-6 DNA Methylase
MQLAEFLDRLGYAESPTFLRPRQNAFRIDPDFGHIFRRASETLALQGVYTLRSDVADHSPSVPIVYVCEAEAETKADDFHRLIWNQDVVPFVLIYTPLGVKLYSGFRHQRRRNGHTVGILQPLTDFNQLDQLVHDFSADAINSGRLWQRRAGDVTPEYRLNWKLLTNLRSVARVLRKRGLQSGMSHALIGKYVYLHYLRDRGILSARKFQRWGIDESAVFGRNASVEGLVAVVAKLDAWLNGNVFPLDFGTRGAPKDEHVRWVAAVFSGDEFSASEGQQLHLDFQAYDFSYIPIETLSVVYEQFLHDSDSPTPNNRGREIGAYYTPIPVINFMLAELAERRPLQRGMRVLDPACGSGAFLVQCYRRLIEREFPPGTTPQPAALRELLVKHIYGVDVEEDACNVAELSLILTLLDYVEPPDLEDRKRGFKLPLLRDRNIFCGNFFDEAESWHSKINQKKFDWVVGNPPWKRFNPKKLRPDEQAVWKWIKENNRERPVGGNQVARAFAWKATEYLKADGQVGFFLPAMTLFENPARDFRQAFFSQCRVRTVANFSNLAEILSARRFRVPAAAFFYQLRNLASRVMSESECVRVYSPLVANQEVTRPAVPGTRGESWSIVINASEIRDLPLDQIASGDGFPWKLATWGSELDVRLLRRLAHRFPTMQQLEDEGRLVVSQGLELRIKSGQEDQEALELVEEVIGKKQLDVDALKRLRHVFTFPPEAIVAVEPELKYGRKGRVGLPLSVCRPPHVIVSAARYFAVYSEQFLVVPPRQIGLMSPSEDRDFLKALSLFLSSDFVFYHQFLTSVEFGVKRDRATLQALRTLPIPFAESDRTELASWVDLHTRLIKVQPRQLNESPTSEGLQLHLFTPNEDNSLQPLLDELNTMVYDSLRLDARERVLVHDLVHVKLELHDGKIGAPAVKTPEEAELHTYAERLKSELDGFISDALPKRHKVDVVHDDVSGMLCVDLVRNEQSAQQVTVSSASKEIAALLEKTRQRLRKERAQWVYFDRNLRIYEGTRTFVLKPMQRFHWTESQAMVDARHIIAETLAAEETRT